MMTIQENERFFRELERRQKVAMRDYIRRRQMKYAALTALLVFVAVALTAVVYRFFGR